MSECFGCHGNKTVTCYILSRSFLSGPRHTFNVARVHCRPWLRSLVQSETFCRFGRRDSCPAWGRTPCCEEARAQAVLTPSWDVDIVELRKWSSTGVVHEGRKGTLFCVELILLSELFSSIDILHGMSMAKISDQSFPSPLLV